jgi:tetratricopeptide (TPR) repeat protein
MSIQAANEALKLKPASDEPWNYICSDYISLKQWDEAMDAAQKGLALNKNNVLLQSNYQFAKSQKQTVGSEVQVALDAVKKNETPENYVNLSLAYYNVKDYQKMAGACKSAIKLNPNYAIAWNNLCSAYNSLHDWDNAIAAGKKALEIDPNYELAKNNLAEALKGKQSKPNK